VIPGNHRLTVRKLADEVGIRIGSFHEIFTEKYQLGCVSAKFVPCLLTNSQTDNIVEISQELLANANCNKIFLRTS
jgi:hypothetical protein